MIIKKKSKIHIRMYTLFFPKLNRSIFSLAAFTHLQILPYVCTNYAYSCILAIIYYQHFMMVSIIWREKNSICIRSINGS
ncbi:MAG: hypothetical protein EXX96DRAFT_569971 [Benjaminiella poitrasii]|nr:MAG: hypothetical protein EXX96DRAFT_569971 [Benjaminiella poitrasii]